tara:strand:- start:3 stop:194 length:192 start_codon:yes stop_codon:yes gene_type:complete
VIKMGVSVWQIILVVAVVLIVFGVGRLPKVMGDLGQGVKNFKKGLNEETIEDKSSNKDDDQKS